MTGGRSIGASSIAPLAESAWQRNDAKTAVAGFERAYGLVAGDNAELDRSAGMRAGDINRCQNFSHTPCGMSFTRTFQEAGYLPARAFGENLAWGQGELGSPVHTLQLWLNSPPHRKNLLGSRWRDLGIAYESGHMFGRDGVALWVLQLGRRR